MPRRPDLPLSRLRALNPHPPRWRRRLTLLLSRRERRRPSRWLWIASLAATIGAALVLTFLLAIATNNRQLYERHYGWLVGVNVVIDFGKMRVDLNRR